MPHRIDRPLTRLLATAFGILLAAGVAQAQVAPGAGATRYLSWANRPADTTPGDVIAARAQARPGFISRRVAPSQPLRRPTLQPVAAPAPGHNGLTPASAWLGSSTVPVHAPDSPDPTAYVAAALAPPSPMSDAVPGAAPVVDPMAPRRDAPIFRIQPQAGAGTPSGDGAEAVSPAVDQPGTAPPGRLGARYYSLHRGGGRQPDPTVIPEPVFFDSVSLDLAEPPATELPLQDGQGRRRAVANADPSLP